MKEKEKDLEELTEKTSDAVTKFAVQVRRQQTIVEKNLVVLAKRFGKSTDGLGVVGTSEVAPEESISQPATPVLLKQKQRSFFGRPSPLSANDRSKLSFSGRPTPSLSATHRLKLGSTLPSTDDQDAMNVDGLQHASKNS